MVFTAPIATVSGSFRRRIDTALASPAPHWAERRVTLAFWSAALLPKQPTSLVSSDSDEFGCGSLDRVALTGLRPSGLPHHRTCGFPHPAVETANEFSSSESRSFGVGPSVGLKGFYPGAFFVPRRLTAVVHLLALDQSIGLQLASLASFAFLRPFALPDFRRASSLLRPLLTSPVLSHRRSPRVRT